MIIWYRNSILASLLSIISCVIAIGGFNIIQEGETGAGILCMAAGIGGVLLAKLISENKEKKQREKRTS